MIISHGRYLGIIELGASASASKLCEWVHVEINLFHPSVNIS